MSVDDITERVVIEQTLLKVHETFVYKVRSKILRSKQSISHYRNLLMFFLTFYLKVPPMATSGGFR